MCIELIRDATKLDLNYSNQRKEVDARFNCIDWVVSALSLV